MSRTPEEREAARLEREAKRRRTTGETSDHAAVPPVDPVRYDPEDFSESVPLDDDPTVPDEPVVSEESMLSEEPTLSEAHVSPPADDYVAAERSVATEQQIATAERPLGVKRLGKPGRPVAQPADHSGFFGFYGRYKAKPRGIPKQAKGMKRKGPIVLLLLSLVALWFLVSLFQPLKGDGSGSVTVQIPNGSTNGEIADILAADDVIGSTFFFELRARISGAKLQSGTFEMKEGMSYGSAIDALSRTGQPTTVIKLTLPEGRSRAELAPVVKKAGIAGNYLSASKRSAELRPATYGAPRTATLEGFLFPATYELQPKTTARRLVTKQLEAFKTNFATVNMAGAKRKNLTAFDVLIIASMVERETALAKERPLVAAVIYNRLKAGMLLGIDATTRYAVDNWTGPLLQSELDSDSPYNTRKQAGLPPGPIGNPGLASIKAAANPAAVDYLFYVVKPCGNGAHAFASTDAQAQRNIAAYNKAREENGGNDPSEC